MTATRRESVSVDRDALMRAVAAEDGKTVDQEMLTPVADAMAEVARVVLFAQGFDVRIERGHGTPGMNDGFPETFRKGRGTIHPESDLESGRQREIRRLSAGPG